MDESNGKKTRKRKSSQWTKRSKSRTVTRKNEWHEIENILEERITDTGIEYKVRWLGYGEEADSWVPICDVSPASIAFYEEKLALEHYSTDSSTGSILLGVKNFDHDLSVVRSEIVEKNSLYLTLTVAVILIILFASVWLLLVFNP